VDLSCDWGGFEKEDGETCIEAHYIIQFLLKKKTRCVQIMCFYFVLIAIDRALTEKNLCL